MVQSGLVVLRLMLNSSVGSKSRSSIMLMLCCMVLAEPEVNVAVAVMAS